MDDIGDYIYLIILAVAALAGIFKKKKPAQDASPEPPSTHMTDMEEELREFLGENKPTPMPAVPQADIPYRVPVSTIYKTYENTSDFSELRVQKQVERPKSKSSTVYPDEITDTFSIELYTVEQAKRAFVYSEIFNRKY